MAGALTLSTFPHDLIRLACSKCVRAGQFRGVSLLQRFGAAASMPDVLERLAACQRRGNYSHPCAAVYGDLCRHLA